jgi:hypothetical protein
MTKAFGDDYKLKYHNRLNSEYSFFSRWCLKIRTKSGEIQPFVLNRVQEYINEKVERQLMETGRVRVLLLKGRQQGASTYIGGRFYWRTTRLSGKATFILSHEASTTEKLFQMVDRFHKNCPDPVRMQLDVANQRRMVFAGGSEYFVGTAGNEDVGRGGTVQYLHASEAAFYQNAIGFSTGLLQSVPDAAGTEIFIESTANGMDPVFYPMCMNALQGKGDYILIFIPWFWQKEYRRQAPADFQPTEEESELVRSYGLDNDQLYWRRLKIIELKDVVLFYREYPCSIEEAFTVSGESLIPAVSVLKARKSGIADPNAPLVIGADPNEAGGPIGIVWRRGRQVIKTLKTEGRKPMEVVNLLAKIIDTDEPVKMFLDNGNGYGIIDRLCELGYDKICVGIDFGGGADEETLYLNKRAEMGCLGAQWFINGGVGIPDDDLFQRHLCSVPARKRTSSNLVKLEPKENIIKNTQIDPHLFDAFILTFAQPVRIESWNSAAGNRIRKSLVSKKQSPLKSVRRREHFERGQEAHGYATASVSL